MHYYTIYTHKREDAILWLKKETFLRVNEWIQNIDKIKLPINQSINQITNQSFITLSTINESTFTCPDTQLDTFQLIWSVMPSKYCPINSDDVMKFTMVTPRPPPGEQLVARDSCLLCLTATWKLPATKVVSPMKITSIAIGDNWLPIYGLLVTRESC